MIGDSGGGSKVRLIGRRLFILSAAKAVVVFGVVGRLISIKLMKAKNTKLYLTKIDFVNGNLFHLEALLKIILETK